MTLLNLNQLPYFKNVLGIDETEYQVYTLVAWTPQAMKALNGAISDIYPLLGYHKRSYMIISAIIGSISVLLLASLELTFSTAKVASALMFGAMVEISFIDLLCEGKYAELMKKKPETKGDLITQVWGCAVSGALIASSFVGVFTDNVETKYIRHIYWIGVPLAIQVVFPLLRGYMPEDYYPPAERRILKEKFNSERNLFYLAFSMAFFALGMAFVNLFGSSTQILVYAILSSLFLSFLGFMQLPKILSFCNFYLFLQEALYVQIPGALDYWYTADNKCVPGGPHFDLTYYLTYTQLIGAIAGFIGIIVFQTVMTNWTYRSSFLVSTFIRIIASMFDVIIISRINIKWGIHDKVAYLFGDALIITTASMLANMPAVLLTTKICPKGYESTTYALLAGFQNFGANVSKAIGISLMGFFNINLSSKAKCTFDNLSLLVFICHFILPLITIPLTWVFIPNARVDSEITTGIEFIRSDIGSGNDISASIELNEKDQLRLRRSSHDKIISPSTKLE